MALPPTNGLHLRHRIHELTPIHVQRDHVVRRTFLKHFEVDHHFDKAFVYFFLSFRKYITESNVSRSPNEFPILLDLL